MARPCPLCDREGVRFRRCACGYDFVSGSPAPAFTRIAHARDSYRGAWRWSLVSTVIGICGMALGITMEHDAVVVASELPAIAGLPIALYTAAFDIVLSRREKQMRARIALPVARVV